MKKIEGYVPEDPEIKEARARERERKAWEYINERFSGVSPTIDIMRVPGSAWGAVENARKLQEERKQEKKQGNNQ